MKSVLRRMQYVEVGVGSVECEVSSRKSKA